MLALTRKVGESIIVGDDARIMILEAKPNFVKLGCIAPKEVEIDREEVRVRKTRERATEDIDMVEVIDQIYSIVGEERAYLDEKNRVLQLNGAFTLAQLRRMVSVLTGVF